MATDVCEEEHICTYRKSKQHSSTKIRDTVLFTCGDCLLKFKNICVLHNHLTQHKEGGSYSYDHITKTGFPKYDSVCAYVQVDDDLFFDSRNEPSEIILDDTKSEVKQSNNLHSDIPFRGNVINGSNSRTTVSISGSTCHEDVDMEQSQSKAHSVRTKSEDDRLTVQESDSPGQQTDEITASEALIAISKTTDNDGKSKHRNKKHATNSTQTSSINSNQTEIKKKAMKTDRNKNTDVEECRDTDTDVQSKAKCPTCGKLGSRAMVSYHRHLHKESKELSCDQCGKTFQHPKCLQLHMKTHELERKYKCTLCPRQFHRKDYLATHMFKHSGQKPFMCELCGKSYRNSMHLKRHITHIHEKVRKFECDICKEKFFRSDHLKCHRQRHFEAEIKCKYCPRKFKLLSDLTRHSVRHTGDSKWMCHLCDHGFNYSPPYYKHMLKVHNIEREEASMFRKLLIEKQKQTKETQDVPTTFPPADKLLSNEEMSAVSIPETQPEIVVVMDTSKTSLSGVKLKQATRDYRTDGSSKHSSDSNNSSGNEAPVSTLDSSEKPSTSDEPVEMFYASLLHSKPEHVLRLNDKQYFTTSIGSTDNSGLDGEGSIHIVSMEETVTDNLNMMVQLGGDNLQLGGDNLQLGGDNLQTVMISDDTECATEVVIDNNSTI